MDLQRFGVGCLPVGAVSRIHVGVRVCSFERKLIVEERSVRAAVATCTRVGGNSTTKSLV